jgi:hypothetical protein
VKGVALLFEQQDKLGRPEYFTKRFVGKDGQILPSEPAHSSRCLADGWPLKDVHAITKGFNLVDRATTIYQLTALEHRSRKIDIHPS